MMMVRWIVAPWFTQLGEDERRSAVKQMMARLAEEQVAFDIGGYAKAPPGLRIWGGATVETADLEAMLPWLDWAWEQLGVCATARSERTSL